MPDTPELQAHFGQPGAQAAGCGFPVAKILALFHAGTCLLLEVVTTPLRSHEMSRVEDVQPALQPEDVLVADLGFCSFAHLALLKRRGVHAVFRIHQRQIIDFAPNRAHARSGAKSRRKGLPTSGWIRQLGPFDQIVEWFKPQSKPEWMSAEDYAALPEVLKVSELNYKTSRSGLRTREVTLMTTLLNAKVYTAAALARLYGTRWGLKVDLKRLKQTIKMDVLKCKHVEGVLKELTINNMVRLVMAAAARRQEVAANRISFVDASRWLLDSKAGDELVPLKVNPDHSGRVEPRVRKQRPKEFRVMKKPRSEWRKQLMGNIFADYLNAILECPPFYSYLP